MIFSNSRFTAHIFSTFYYYIIQCLSNTSYYLTTISYLFKLRFVSDKVNLVF